MKSAEQFNLDGPLDRGGRCATHPRRRLQRAYDRVVRRLRAVVSARRSIDAGDARHSARRVSPRRRSARRGHGRRSSKSICSSTASCCATTAQRPTTDCPPAKARFSPAASGSPTTTRCSAADDDARRLFERLLALRNDVGLLSEEYDPRLKRQVGNFPQAFSHVALLSTAFNLGHADISTRRARPSSDRTTRATTFRPDRPRGSANLRDAVARASEIA